MSLCNLRRSLCCVVLAPLLATGAPVSARVVAPDASADAERAQQQFARGVALFEDGDFESALFEFESAYEMSQNPHLLYNIAVSQYELHDYAASALAYRRYLSELEGELPSDRVEQVTERLRTLELRVGTLIVDSDPSGAVVSIEGKVAGVTPVEITVNLGEAVVSAEKDGYERGETTVRVVGGERTSVQLELAGELREPSAVPAPRLAAPVERTDGGTDDADKRLERLEIGTWVAFGIAVGAGIGAAVTGSLAVQSNNDLEDARARETTQGELDDLSSTRDTRALTTDVLIGVAAVAAVTSIALGATLIVRRKRQRIAFEPAAGRIRF